MGSLEDLHGSIHVAVGGSMGHMSQLQYSAFDPIFWLHHGNVDRLFATWQVLNPNAYAINKVETDGTFSIRGGTSVTPDTPLAPFNDATGKKFWTSNTSKRTEAFNYAYPETQRWKFTSDALYVTSVRQAVYSLYGGVTRVFRQGGNPTDNISMASIEPGIAAQKPLQDTSKPVSAAADQPQAKPASTSTNKPAEKAHGTGIFAELGHRIQDALSGDHQPKDGTRGLDLESEIGKPDPNIKPKDTSYIEYICTLKGPKHILEQTYVVHVFLGQFSPDTNTWCTQNALVGTFTVFGKALTTGCEKCAVDAEAELEVSGTVNLTTALIKEAEDGHLGSMQRENVLPWLRDNLHWRVTLADGTEKAREEVQHLKVGVVSTDVRLPAGGLPEFSGVYQVHTEVTEGRPAGLNPPVVQG